MKMYQFLLLSGIGWGIWGEINTHLVLSAVMHFVSMMCFVGGLAAIMFGKQL